MTAQPHGRGRPRARAGEGVASRARRLGLAASLALATLAPARLAAAADDAQEFEIGKNRFDAGQYEDAARRFSTMLDPAVPPCEKSAPKKSGRCRLSDKDLIERARAFAAASLIALRRTTEADAHIERVLRENPSYAPNPAIFPQEVIDRFTEVRGRLRAELEEAARQKAEEERARLLAAQKIREDEEKWMADIQRLAGEERIIAKNSRLLAIVPFGVGQFQNGDKGLGLFFAISQGVTGSASLVSASIYNYFISVDRNAKDPETNQPVDTVALDSSIQTVTTINRIAFGAWAALTLAGIVHAQLTFKPEVATVRQRPLPKKPTQTMLPTVSFAPGAAGVGLIGRF